jgi:hypothetical protein
MPRQSEWAKLINSVVPKIAALRAQQWLRDREVMEAIFKLRTNYRPNPKKRAKR